MWRSVLPALAGLAIVAGAAAAQSDYPSRPVKIVVPATPGGGSDTFARLVGQHLSTALGQQFVIDNRPGGGTLIGMEAVAGSPPDGYTLYLSPSTTTTMHLVRKTMPFDVTRAFVPVTQLVVLPQVLVVHPSVPAKTVQEFVALAKSQPGKLSYGSAGIGTAPHMAMELFKSLAQIDVQHIPYRGVSGSLTDVMAGRVSGMIVNVLTAKQHVEKGSLRALGVTGSQRTNAMPNVPTIAEAGVPKYEALQWFGILAPAGTPASIVSRLQVEIAKGLNTPEIKKRLATDGAEPVASTPAAFAATIKSEIDKWTAVAKAANIKPQQ